MQLTLNIACCREQQLYKTKLANHFKKELNESLAQVKNSGLGFTKAVNNSSCQITQGCSGSHL